MKISCKRPLTNIYAKARKERLSEVAERVGNRLHSPVAGFQAGPPSRDGSPARMQVLPPPRPL